MISVWSNVMSDMPNAGNGNDMMHHNGGKAGDPRLIGVRRYPYQGAVNGSEHRAGSASENGQGQRMPVNGQGQRMSESGQRGGEQIQRMRMTGQNDRGVRMPPMRPVGPIGGSAGAGNHGGNPTMGSADMHTGTGNSGAQGAGSASENGAVRHDSSVAGSGSHVVRDSEHRAGASAADGLRPGAGLPQRPGHVGLRPAVGDVNGTNGSHGNAVNSDSRIDGRGLANAVSSNHNSGERAAFNSSEHNTNTDGSNQIGRFNGHANTSAHVSTAGTSTGTGNTKLSDGVHHPVLRPRFAESVGTGAVNSVSSGAVSTANSGDGSHAGTGNHVNNVGSHDASGVGKAGKAGSDGSGFSSKADDESRYRHDAAGRRLNGVGTGRRAGDKAKRDSRASVNAVLNDEQVGLVNRLNKQLLKRDSRAKAFQMTKRDQQVLDYLVRFRFATIRDVSRVAGWSESYMKTNRRFNAYLDLGLVRAERVPLENFRYVQATPLGVKLSLYSFLGSENDNDVLRSNRGHQFGLSSLASHLMNHRRDADETEHDLLGLGDDEWLKLRHEILSGASHVVSEREYRSSWTRIRVSATGRSPSSLTDAKYRHAMENLYRKAHENPDDMSSELKGDTFEFFSTNPEYMGENAWLWVIYGNDVIQNDGNGGIRRLSVDSGMVSLDDKGRPVINTQRGDLFSTQDHCPDLVIARPRDRKTGRPNSIAVELEITGKDIDDYFQTMCGYTSRCGRLLYKMVVWQVVNAAVGNKIRAGAVKAGAVEGRDFIITTVYSKDMRSSYNRGADMLPGKWADNDNPYGYTVERTSDEEAGYADLAGLLNE